MINWKTAALLMALAVAAACGRDARSAERTLSRDRFIEANQALRQIDRNAANADSLREAVLAEHGVTEEQLRAFVTARSDRPSELAAVWDEIHRRLDEAEGSDESPEPPPTVQAEMLHQPDMMGQPDTAGIGTQPEDPIPMRARRRIMGQPSLETAP